MAQMVKNLATVQETRVQSLGQEDPPGESHGQRSLARTVRGSQTVGRNRTNTSTSKGSICCFLRMQAVQVCSPRPTRPGPGPHSPLCPERTQASP